jgi:hypothetical protein
MPKLFTKGGGDKNFRQLREENPNTSFPALYDEIEFDLPPGWGRKDDWVPTPRARGNQE